MELSIALENINCVNEKFAAEEIEIIRQNRDEAIPVLLQRVKEISERGEVYDDSLNIGVYESYLLAEFRVHEAFQYLVSWLDFSDEYIEWLLCDIVTDGFPNILASCAQPEDIPRLKAIATTKGKDWSVRLSALNAITILYAEGELAKSEIVSIYSELLADTDDEEFLTFVLTNAMHIYLEEFFETIRELFDKDIIDTQVIDRKWFEEFIQTHDERSAIDSYLNPHHHFISDSVKEMEWWACFHPERESMWKAQRKEDEKKTREIESQRKRGTKKKYRPKKKKK